MQDSGHQFTQPFGLTLTDPWGYRLLGVDVEILITLAR